jgi:hypothetical protein
VEGSYQARARSYWLASDLVGQIGGAALAQDQVSLQHLLSLTEEMRGDIGHLAQQVGTELPSLSLSLHVELADEGRRAEFMADVQRLAQLLARKYGATAGDTDAQPPKPLFRLILACYPKT